MQRMPKRLFWQMTVPVQLVVLAGIVFLALIIPRAVEWNVKATAKENALDFARDFQGIRNYYNNFVVREVLNSDDLTVTHEHQSSGTIPTPATFLKEMTRQSANEDVRVDLYSPFPFSDTKTDDQDEFRKEAWAALSNDPDAIVVRMDDVDGQATVRVAMADRLTSETCVSCHNNHPDSPRSDWKLGDVRGVLEVRSNVDGPLKRATIASFGLLVVLVCGGVLLTLINGRNARAISKPLKGMSHALIQLSSGNRDFALPQATNTEEVRELWNAFHAFQEHDGEREKLREQVHELAYYDALTALPNRASFCERLDREIGRANRDPGLLVAVMLLDLDHFRDVNNAFGHDAGDELLKTLGDRLSRLDGHHLIVARMSEDEFGLIVCQSGGTREDQEPVSDSVRKIIASVEEPIELKDQSFNLSGSVGIAIYPKDGMTRGVLLKSADLALHSAKQEGRRTYRYFSHELEAEVTKRIQMTRDLRVALEGNELYPCFQPQFDIRSGAIVGAELLLRWRRPDGTNISPADFIPVAEQSGLIVPIGRRILRDACELSIAWREAGMSPIRIAVNVSAIEFDQADFLESVEAVLAQTGMNPNLLEVELTESATMNEVDLVIDIMNRLNQMGLALAIDDFGTGYSSLSYLKQLPIDHLKIDQSFIRDLITDADDAAIARTIIGLGKNLGLNVIAEGVENEETLQFLEAQGCDEAQGFHLARPLPAHEFFDFVLEHQNRTTQSRVG